MLGPSKYNDLCTQVREAADAPAVVLIVIEGNRGSGMAVQSVEQIAPAMLAEVLDGVCVGLRAEDNSRPMTTHHQAAYALMTIGKAAGALSNDDVRHHVIESMRRGELRPEYFTMLRDRLDEVLRASGAAVDKGQGAIA